MHDHDFTKILGWPGYRAFRHEINEVVKTLRLWLRRKAGVSPLDLFEVRGTGCGINPWPAPKPT